MRLDPDAGEAGRDEFVEAGGERAGLGLWGFSGCRAVLRSGHSVSVERGEEMYGGRVGAARLQGRMSAEPHGGVRSWCDRKDGRSSCRTAVMHRPSHAGRLCEGRRGGGGRRRVDCRGAEVQPAVRPRYFKSSP